jgi:hypothetical protein
MPRRTSLWPESEAERDAHSREYLTREYFTRPPDAAAPLLCISDERQAAELRRAAALARYGRRLRRELVGVLLICWRWMLLGALCLAWAVHATDAAEAEMAWSLGFGVGYGGSFFTLVAWYVRGAERGDW